MSDVRHVPRSMQSWVSTIHTVVLTADVFQLFIKNIFLPSGIFLVRLTYPFLSRTSKYFVLEVYISGMGVRGEWFVSIITSSKYNGEKKAEWTRRFVPPNERRKLEREICSARWICHLFISRRSYAVYLVRFTTSGTRYYYHPDTRRYACPSSSFRCSRKRPSLKNCGATSGASLMAVSYTHLTLPTIHSV